MNEKNLGILVSVRNIEEAKIASYADVDIIDIKEPLAGSLGAASFSTISAIAESFPSNQVLSIALGEIPECEDWLARYQIPDGINFAKCGLANTIDTDWKSKIVTIWNRISSVAKPVAVAYADSDVANSPEPESILDLAVDSGVEILLIDTFEKNGTSTFDHLDLDYLKHLVSTASSRSIKTVLAGTIGEPNIESAIKTGADFVGVRGAVCESKRDSTLCEHKTVNFCRAIRSKLRELKTANT